MSQKQAKTQKEIMGDSDDEVLFVQTDEKNCCVNSAMALKELGVLDCFICLERIRVPVLQCQNGYTACSSCSNMLHKKICPICLLPIDTIRCRAIEIILESIKSPCENAGCKEMLNYNEKQQHQDSCISCPLPECDSVVPFKDLYSHFEKKLRYPVKKFQYNNPCYFVLNVKDKIVILQQQNDGVLFAVNNNDFEQADKMMTLLSVSCIDPRAPKKRFKYVLSMEYPGRLSLESFTQNNTETMAGNISSSSSAGRRIPCHNFGDSGKIALSAYVSDRA